MAKPLICSCSLYWEVLQKLKCSRHKLVLDDFCCSVSRKWSLSCGKCFGYLLRLAKVIVDRFCRRSAVFFFFFLPVTSRLFVEVVRRQPVTTRNASLVGLSMKGVLLLWHMRDHSIQQESEQVLKIAVRRIFLTAHNFILPIASQVQHVKLVFGAVTPSVFETRMFCPATHQDMLFWCIKELVIKFYLQ